MFVLQRMRYVSLPVFISGRVTSNCILVCLKLLPPVMWDIHELAVVVFVVEK